MHTPHACTHTHTFLLYLSISFKETQIQNFISLHLHIPLFLYLYLFHLLFSIGVELINNIVLGSGVQQSDSVIHARVHSFSYYFCYDLLLLLLQSHFSRVRLCATPEMAAHQAPPSLGYSRQEHWSGLPFPSPMHESEK